MALYRSTCPLCGKEYDNYYPENYRRFCSLYCTYYDDTDSQKCEHGYVDELCVKCHGE